MTTTTTERPNVKKRSGDVKKRSGDWLASGPRPMRSLKIEDDLWDRLTRMAEQQKVSRSRLIRDILWYAVDPANRGAALLWRKESSKEER